MNQQCAQPKCDDGLDKLELGQVDQENCGSCIADVEDFPCIKGVAGCSSGIFCIENDLCGDAKTSMTFGKDGDLDQDTDMYSYYLTNSPEVYELRIIATPQDEDTFGSCTAAIDSTACQACTMCADGISFTFDCSDRPVGDSMSAGPVITDCLNFMFRKV